MNNKTAAVLVALGADTKKAWCPICVERTLWQCNIPAPHSNVRRFERCLTCDIHFTIIKLAPNTEMSHVGNSESVLNFIDGYQF